MNDVRQRKVARHTGWKTDAVYPCKICIHREYFTGSHFNCNVHQYSLDGNISAESFPFLPEIFFGKDCIEELTHFVAAVK